MSATSRDESTDSGAAFKEASLRCSERPIVSMVRWTAIIRRENDQSIVVSSGTSEGTSIY